MKRLLLLFLVLLLFFACKPTSPMEPANNTDDSYTIYASESEDPLPYPKVDYCALYGIPERLTCTYTDTEGKVIVQIDAPITVPDVSMPVVRVSAEDFDQETVTRIWNVLIGNTPMFELVDEQIVNRKARIQQDLQFCYSLLDDPDLMEQYFYDSEDAVRKDIAFLQTEYQKAVDAAPKENRRVDSVMWRRSIGFDDNPDLTHQLGLWAISEDESIRFTVYNSTDNRDPIYEHVDGGWNVIQNNRQASLIYRRASVISDAVLFEHRKIGIPFGTIVSETDPLPERAKTQLPYSPKKAADKVRAFLEQTGLSYDFTIAYICLEDDAGVYYHDKDSETLPHEPTQFYYRVVCVRKVNGVPCCNIEMNVQESRENESTRTAYAPSWAYEGMTVYLDADGIFRFAWGTPLTKTDTLTASGELLPFNEIEAIAGRLLPLQYIDEANRVIGVDPNAYLPITELAVTRITLGLWRIAEQGKLGDGFLVPAYCFYGDLKSTYYQDGTCRTECNNLLFVINAIDGSIIDPSRGY